MYIFYICTCIYTYIYSSIHRIGKQDKCNRKKEAKNGKRSDNV